MKQLAGEPMKKVVVVDNHPMMVRFMESLLTSEGFQVRCADNGLSALDLLREDVPDFLFVDLIMPQIDGATLCRIVRRVPRFSQIKLVVLSAIAAEEDIPADLDVDLFIAKGPFSVLGPIILGAVQQIEMHQGRRILGLERVHPREITRELLQVRRNFSLVLERMAEGMLEITPAGRVVYANRASLVMFQLPCEQMLGSDLFTLIPPAYHADLKEAMALGSCSDLAAANEPWHVEDRHLFIQIFPLTPEEDSPLIVILQDATERIVREQQLAEAEKFRAIGTLAAGLAHDFNNLLMAIQGNISLLQMDLNPSHPHWNRLSHMEQQVSHGARLTQQLLGYARRSRYDLRVVDVVGAVVDAVTAFPLPPGISMEQRLDKDLPPIRADAGQLNQVLLNILFNARDACGSGGRIEISTRLVTHNEILASRFRAQPGSYVEIAVSDDGCGMDEATQARIFDPFFTTKSAGRGTGLGLASVYGIVKGHQGYVTVSSQPGIGSSFYLYFPVLTDEQAQVASAGPAALNRGTVLLVDDCESFRGIAKELLHRLGFQVLAATEAREATAMLAELGRPPALVLLDLNLPHGKEGPLALAIRQRHPGVPLLFLSGRGSQEMPLADVPCLHKPFTLQELREALAKLVPS
jgi:signal transduction histidine kinase